MRLRTGLNVGQSAGFPSVLGKFHLFWGFSITPGAADRYVGQRRRSPSTFDGLALDAGKFITEFLGPMIKQVKDVTNPLMPVVEMIQGEVPIISDLSKLVGQGPVTVLDLLEAISGNDLSLMRSILQMIKFVNSLPADGAFVIPLGSGDGGRELRVNTTAPPGARRCPTTRTRGSPAAPPSPTAARTSSTSSATATARPYSVRQDAAGRSATAAPRSASAASPSRSSATPARSSAS